MNLQRPRTFSGRIVLAAAAWLGLAALGGTLLACNVPVFRYALERWLPDPYRATVFHRGPLSAEQQAALKPIDGGAAGANLNLAVRTVDVAELDRLDATDRKLFEPHASAALPQLVVQYPRAARIDRTIWAGPLADDAAKQLADSPLRRELIRRLAAGQTAVWLLLECSDATKNDAVARLLEVELVKLALDLKLPELTSAPEDNLLSEMPLKIAFSSLRVPRNVAAENRFVDVLLHAEEDLLDFDEPMVFPVFGRGRTMLPLIGAGITSDNLHESASFLVGACSCEIKDLNPGFDLPLNVDWNELLFRGAPPRAALAKPSAALDGAPELVPIPSGLAKSTAVASADSSPASNVDAPLRQASHLPILLGSLAAACGLALAFKRLI